MKNFKLFEKCNRRIARRVTLIAVLLAMCMPQAWAGNNCGFWTSGSGEITFTANGVSKTMAFDNSTSDYTSIGTVTTLEISSFWIKTWKKHIKDGDFTGNVCQVEMYYAIHTSKNVWGDDSEKHKLIALHDGSYTDNYTDNWTTYNQQWKHISSTDVLDGLTPGTTYWIDFYFEIQGNNGSKDDCYGQQATLNNNKGNYHASFTYASEKTTFEPGQYVYLDARNQSWWKGADFDARFYFKRYDTSADIGDAVVCSHSNKLEDWVYYAIVPDNDYVGKLQVNRVNTSDADMSNYWWNNTTVKVASDRSNASQNCLNGTSSTSSDWDASWGTYCPPKATSVIEDNGTVTYGGDGGSSTPYLVEKGGTIKVQASSTNILEDGNMMTKYHFYDNTTSKSGEQSGSTYQFTASSSANITYQMRVNSYNQYNSTNSSDKYSDKKYYKTVICYTVTYNANGGTGSVPAVSGSKYMSGTNVTLATNTGSLAKSGYKLVGWNTADNGTGTHYDLGATLSSISANQTLYAEWLQIHTPSQFSYTSDYGKTPKLVSGYNYEWYSISKNGSGWFVLAGEQTASVSGGAANIAMTLPGTDTYKHQNWFTAKYEATNGSYAPGVAKTGVFEDVMSSGPCIRLKDSDEGLKMAVSGYSEFSFIATDNTADKSKNKYIKVIIDGDDVTGSKVSASASIRSFAITSNDAHLIELRPAGGNGSSDFYCFALKLPDEVATYDITYECYSATSGCPSNADGQTALPDPLPSAPTKNGYDFDAWYTDNTFETEAVAGATLDDDVTLYAKWTCTTPTISNQPEDETVCKDESSPTLSVTASANGGSLSYQWYSNTTKAATVDNEHKIDKATSASYSAPTSAVGTKYYYCVVTNTTGSCSTTVTSDIATVTVNAATAIGTQPTSIAKANVGSAQTLSVVATGSNLTYQWQTCNSGGTEAADVTGSSYSGGKTSTLTFTPSAAGVTYYKCVVTGDCGTSISNVVSITAKNAISPTLSYASTVTYGSTVSPTLSGAGDGEVSYSLNSVTPASSLTIVSSTGVVSGAAAGGTATVTATIEDGTNYWGGSATSGTITVSKADLSVTATAGTATSVTHNSATLPFTLSSTTGVASVTLKVYDASDDSEPVKTVSGVTAATSGSGAVTGLSAETTYYFKVKPIGDANHNDGSESAKSATFTTSAAPTLTAIEAGVVYDADEMIPDGQTVTVGDVIFNDDSYSEGNLFYTKAGSKGPKANTGDQPNITIGEGQVYEASFKSNMMYIKGTATLSGTPKIPSAPSIKFKIPAGGGTLYLYGPTNTTAKFIKEGDAEGTAIANANKYISVEVDGGDICYVYGSSDDKSGFYGLKLVTCTDPGLAFAEDSKTTTLCDAAPTNALTYTHSVAVSYTSSDETVATVASDGTLTIKKAGTTTITASSLEQTVSAVTYCADNASYTLTVNASTAAGLAYGTATMKKNVGDANFTNTLTNSHSLDVTYTSSDEAVATVDSNGEVTIKGAGTTTITASSAQQKVSSTCYAAGSATYTLTVYPVYTVTYNAMGGTCSPTSTNITTALGKVTLPSATHASYTTYSWVTSDGTEAGDAGDTYAPEGNINLYAKWSGSCAGGGGTSVRFLSTNKNDAGNNFADMSTSSNTTQMVGDGTAKLIAIGSASLNDANNKIGYRDDGRLNVVFKFSEATTLDIYFNANATSKTFKLSSFSSDKALKDIATSDYSSRTAVTSGITVAGAAFASSGKSTTSGAGSASSGVITLTTAGGIKVTYSSLAAGCYVFEADGSGNEGYLYGYDLNGGGSSCYTVTYDGNGATSGYTNDPTQYTSGQSPEILDCGYTKTGYAFMGWADGTDHRDAGTVDYQPGNHITSISDDVTLYAIWKQIKYFTGAASTTSWNTDGNWSPSGVPAITDPVVIQANVTVDINNAKALRVDIETGKTLTINAGKALIIAETLTKNGGATAAADVIINSTRDAGVGALIIGSEAGDNAATMNFETKAKLVGGSTVNQFIGSPFSNAAPYVDYGQQLYKFCPKQNGDRGWWQSHTSLATMTPFWGYNVLCTETSFLNLNWTGKLNPSESKTITDFYYNGSSETDNMFANSWTAPIHVGAFEDGDFVNASTTLYMFNAGTPAQEAGNDGSNADNSNDDPGTYISIPIHSAPYAGIGVIPSMQAFYVLSTGSGASITLDYNKIVYTPALTSVGIVANRAPKHNAEVVEPEVIKLHVQSETGWGANTYVLGRADFAEGYEDGWDGAYIEGESATPKLYTPSIDGNMFINCLPEIEGTVVGFRKGSSDNNYIFSFDYNGDEVWYLNDQKAQKSTQIMNGQTYAFESEAGDNAARFVISATPINKIATGCESVGAEAAKVRKLIINDKVYIIRGGQVFDVLGKTIKK